MSGMGTSLLNAAIPANGFTCRHDGAADNVGLPPGFDGLKTQYEVSD
jgi:hypothetical protein